jgi:hypothetical protein
VHIRFPGQDPPGFIYAQGFADFLGTVVCPLSVSVEVTMRSHYHNRLITRIAIRVQESTGSNSRKTLPAARILSAS